MRTHSMSLGLLRETIWQAARLYSVMVASNALFIALAGVLSPPSASSSSSSSATSVVIPWLTDLPYVVEQVTMHLLFGALAGGVSLDPMTALVGAGVGPLIDVDHVAALLGLPGNPRIGHSVFLVLLMILLDWRLHFWSRGTRNFSLFVALEYAVHLAVAPPGFPLLSPFSSSNIYFSWLFPAVVAVPLAIALFMDCRRRRTPSSPGGQARSGSKRRNGPSHSLQV